MTNDSSARETLAQLLGARHSVRHFSPAAIAAPSLQRLLRSAQGDAGDDRRNAPSAHGLYPLTLFVIVRRIDDAAVAPGLYAIDRAEGRLGSRLGSVAPGSLLATSLADDEWLETSAAVVVIAADYESARAHFAEQPPDGRRGHRYVDIEAGAVLQNLYLSATAEGLGGVAVAGFDDALLADVLALPGDYAPVALFCAGMPAQTDTS